MNIAIHGSHFPPVNVYWIDWKHQLLSAQLTYSTQ